jgi:hypothetical protein
LLGAHELGLEITTAKRSVNRLIIFVGISLIALQVALYDLRQINGELFTGLGVGEHQLSAKLSRFRAITPVKLHIFCGTAVLMFWVLLREIRYKVIVHPPQGRSTCTVAENCANWEKNRGTGLPHIPEAIF